MKDTERLQAERRALRQTIRRRRRELSQAERDAASDAVRSQLCAGRFYADAASLACYLPVQGELDARPIMQQAHTEGKAVYLPILDAGEANELRFRRWHPQVTLLANRLGIPEPEPQPMGDLPGDALDLVVAPLVAFDADGNRLGQGGGYYDRTFEHLRGEPERPPLLMGVGYAFQEIGPIAPEPWDVALDAIVTDERLVACDPRGRLRL